MSKKETNNPKAGYSPKNLPNSQLRAQNTLWLYSAKGVGTNFAVNIAFALKSLGLRVGILDAILVPLF